MHLDTIELARERALLRVWRQARDAFLGSHTLGNQARSDRARKCLLARFPGWKRRLGGLSFP